MNMNIKRIFLLLGTIISFGVFSDALGAARYPRISAASSQEAQLDKILSDVIDVEVLPTTLGSTPLKIYKHSDEDFYLRIKDTGDRNTNRTPKTVFQGSIRGNVNTARIHTNYNPPFHVNIVKQAELKNILKREMKNLLAGGHIPETDLKALIRNRTKEILDAKEKIPGVHVYKFLIKEQAFFPSIETDINIREKTNHEIFITASMRQGRQFTIEKMGTYAQLPAATTPTQILPPTPAPAVAQQEIEFLSTAVVLSPSPAVSHSLDQAYDELKNQNPLRSIQDFKILSPKYHMTLVRFNLLVKPGHSQEEKRMIQTRAIDTLLSIARSVMAKTQRTLPPIIMHFKCVHIWDRWLVAEFQMDQHFKQLIDTIAHDFSETERLSPDPNSPIIGIENLAAKVLPIHISLSEFKQKHSYSGQCLYPIRTQIKPMHINEGSLHINSEWRIKKPRTTTSLQTRFSTLGIH